MFSHAWLKRVWGGARADPVEDADGAPRGGSSSDDGAGCAEYTVEPGVDYPGNDLNERPVPAADAAACCAVCERSRLCNAYTFVHAANQCWLKRRRPQRSRRANAGEVTSAHRWKVKHTAWSSSIRGGGASTPRTGAMSSMTGFIGHAAARSGSVAAQRRESVFDRGSSAAYLARQAQLQQQQVRSLLREARSAWEGVVADDAPLVRLDGGYWSVDNLSAAMMRDATGRQWCVRAASASAAASAEVWAGSPPPCVLCLADARAPPRGPLLFMPGAYSTELPAMHVGGGDEAPSERHSSKHSSRHSPNTTLPLCEKGGLGRAASLTVRAQCAVQVLTRQPLAAEAFQLAAIAALL